MAANYSFKEFLGFLEYASNMGLLKANTMIAWRTAASKIADDLTEQEAEDVRAIDLDLLFQRFVNRNKVEVSPSTLMTYKQRLGKAIGEFVRWRDDPTSYKPTAGPAGPRKRPEKQEPKARTRREGNAEAGPDDGPPEKFTNEPATKTLTLPFPLRSDFLATVQIPRDLKRVEAERLAAFIKTLAVDSESGEG
jgi:hypothetical protein